MARPRKKHIFLRIISTLLWLVTMATVGMLTYELYTADIMPLKYFEIIGGVVVLLLIIFFL